MAAALRAAGIRSPAVIIVGEVARFAACPIESGECAAAYFARPW